MGHRLSKIVTRTGDQGTTGLADGSRVPKDHVRIQAIGDVDELNSAIGLLRAHELTEPLDQMLSAVQQDLFDLGGELSMPGMQSVSRESVARLSDWVSELNEPLPPLKEFILPAGPLPVCACHMARTICRRAERSLVSLHYETPLRSDLLSFINRLSDLLFVMARCLTAREDEIPWRGSRPDSAG